MNLNTYTQELKKKQSEHIFIRKTEAFKSLLGDLFTTEQISHLVQCDSRFQHSEHTYTKEQLDKLYEANLIHLVK